MMKFTTYFARPLSWQNETARDVCARINGTLAAAGDASFPTGDEAGDFRCERAMRAEIDRLPEDVRAGIYVDSETIEVDD